MLSFPNCKINIGLHITGKRDDGFHNIETILYPLKWSDVLEINKRENLKEDKFSFTDGVSLKLTGHEIDGAMETNLCFKAYQLLKNEFNLGDAVIHLHKIIPPGAGLGGGSADGAFTLKLLNALFHLNLTDEQLKLLAAKLGSDCAFFIKNEPAFATGKGDELSDIFIFLRGYHVTLVKPGISISTAEAYQNVIPKQPVNSLIELIAQPVKSWKEIIVNDFEDGVFKIYPEIQKIKNKLYELGCIYASMSGSGSCLYGISYEKINIENKFNNSLTWQGIL